MLSPSGATHGSRSGYVPENGATVGSLHSPSTSRVSMIVAWRVCGKNPVPRPKYAVAPSGANEMRYSSSSVEMTPSASTVGAAGVAGADDGGAEGSAVAALAVGSAV